MPKAKSRWKYVSADPTICGGRPCFKGTRIPVSVVLNFMAAGESTESILKNYPSISIKHIAEALSLAADAVDFEEIILSA